MSTISPELAARLAATVTTICHCWRLARRDGIVLGFTDHDRAITFGGTSFEPQSGLTASEARRSLGLGADAMDITGALSSDRISDGDIEAGLYDGATVETYLVNWRNPEECARIARAVLGRISRSDGAFTAELESPLQSLDRPDGRYFRRSCDAELGDAACGVDLDQPGFSAIGTVTGRPGPNLVRAAGLAGFAAEWFSHGWLKPAAGDPVRVLSHRLEEEQALIALDVDVPFVAVQGATFEIRAGCDKRFATCRSKFANAVDFRGFPHLPGNDAAYAYASEGLTFDGGPLVP